ncbi:MAG TPA: hypothetical protein VG389_27685 [Myxococcota bacterium]|nr:hypothetical protein [Myxococcota bacterium]
MATVGDGGSGVCDGTGTCDYTCDGDCSVDCSGASACIVRCAAGATCTLNGCDAPAMIVDCGGGVEVCRTARPAT